MSKKLIKAIKDLPDEYVNDDSQFCEYGGQLIVVANKNLGAMTWLECEGWKLIELDDKQEITGF